MRFQLHKRFRTRPLRIKLQNLLVLLSLTVVGVSLLVAAVVLYSGTSAFTKEKLDAIQTTNFNQITTEIEEFYESADKIAAYLQNNKQLIGLLQEFESTTSDTYRQSKLYMDINKWLVNLTTYNGTIKGINIITANSQFYSGQVLFKRSFAESLAQVQTEGKSFWYPARLTDREPLSINKIPQVIQSLEQESYFMLPLLADSRFYGTVYLLLKESPLIRNADKKKSIMLLDGNGEVVYRGASYGDANVADLLKLPFREGEIVKSERAFHSRIIYGKKISINGWTVLFSADAGEYDRQAGLLLKLAAASFVVSFIASLLSARAIAKRIVRPALGLAAYIKRYNIGDASGSYIGGTDRRRQISLREKIFYYFIITIIIPVGGFVLLFHLLSSATLSEQIKSGYAAVFEKSAENTALYLDKQERLLFGQSNSDAIQRYLSGAGTGGRDIGDIVEEYINLGMDGEFSLYDNAGRPMLSTLFRQKPMDEEQYRKLQHAFPGTVWSYDKDRSGRNTIKIAMRVSNLSFTAQIGYAAMEIRQDDFSRNFAELSPGDRTFVLHKNGSRAIALQRGEQFMEQLDGESGIQETVWNGTSHYMFYHKLGDKPWYLVSLYSKQDIDRQSMIVLANNAYMLGALLLTVFLLAFTISWALLFPIHRMNESLDVSELANVVKLPEGPYTIDEINELAVNFNRMLERIEDMFDELLIVNRKKNEVEADKKEAELRALQAQINPHFLQNTLNNLIHMIQEGYAAPAISMIQSLSRLFRYGISRGETIIPLREEIEYAKAYAAIMDMRYRGTIHFEWKVDNEALQFKTLKLVLQPLIENAIVHGFRERREGGCIAISCEDAGDYNVLTVSDNGKGITADDLQALRARLYGEDKGGDHIGILNVEQRLRLFFGESCSLTIDSVANKGTTVSLRIPKLTGEEP